MLNIFRKSIWFTLLIILMLTNCQTTSKQINTEEQHGDIKYKQPFYLLGLFPIPKYYDLDKKVKRMVVISPKYQEGYKRELQDQLVQTLWKFPSVQLIEREQIEDLVKEQKLGTTGLISTETATEIGKLSGADHIFTYSIEASRNNEETYQSGAIWGKINARIYNTETGEIVYLCSAVSKSLITKLITPEHIKKFYYLYTQSAIIYAFFGFKESLQLSFGQSALGIIYISPTDPKTPFQLAKPSVNITWLYSPANKAGLMCQDLIVQADGRKVYNRNQLDEILSQHDPKQPMEIKILRKGVEKTLYIKFQ